ncbi:MAG: C39 family peptidase [Candidatus Altiarchaeota archaeon]|nr:C39 family peptidase [Candidatus Altiarchaeota archaeon]
MRFLRVVLPAAFLMAALWFVFAGLVYLGVGRPADSTLAVVRPSEAKLSAESSTTTTAIVVPSTAVSTTAAASTSTTILQEGAKSEWLYVTSPENELFRAPVAEGEWGNFGGIGFVVMSLSGNGSIASVMAFDRASMVVWNRTTSMVTAEDGVKLPYGRIYSAGMRELGDFAIIAGRKYYYMGCSNDAYHLARGRFFDVNLGDDAVNYNGYGFWLGMGAKEGGSAGGYNSTVTTAPEKFSCPTTTLPLPRDCSIRMYFERQDTLTWCGPAIIRGVMRYYGVSRSEGEIAQSVISPSGITNINDMADYLTGNGLSILFYEGPATTMEVIENAVCEEKRPVIVLQRFNGTNDVNSGHYRVIVGLDADFVYMQDPYQGLMRVSYGDFWLLSEANRATVYDNQAIVVYREP